MLTSRVEECSGVHSLLEECKETRIDLKVKVQLCLRFQTS